MNDAAFFVLMLTGMLGYLALIRRALARKRRPGRTMDTPAALTRQAPPSTQTDDVADTPCSRGDDRNTSPEERTGGNRPHT